MAQKFYPNPPADLSDIDDPGLARAWVPAFDLRTTITAGDIAKALSKAGPGRPQGRITSQWAY